MDASDVHLPSVTNILFTSRQLRLLYTPSFHAARRIALDLTATLLLGLERRNLVHPPPSLYSSFAQHTRSRGEANERPKTRVLLDRHDAAAVPAAAMHA